MENNVGANNYAPQRKNRRSIRLKGYDYSRAGAYFVSVCAHNRACLFGEIADLSAFGHAQAGRQMVLNDAGRMVEFVWGKLPVRFDRLELDEFVVMPNHIHSIFVLCRRGEPCVRPMFDQPAKQGEHKVRPYGTLPNTVGRIVQAFKSVTTHEYINGVKQHGWPPFPGKLWQRNYYEHVIRNENELNRIREYIINNPKKWAFDRDNPDVM